MNANCRPFAPLRLSWQTARASPTTKASYHIGSLMNCGFQVYSSIISFPKPQEPQTETKSEAQIATEKYGLEAGLFKVGNPLNSLDTRSPAGHYSQVSYLPVDSLITDPDLQGRRWKAQQYRAGEAAPRPVRLRIPDHLNFVRHYLLRGVLPSG